MTQKRQSARAFFKPPQVDKVLRHAALKECETRVRRDILARLVRDEIEMLRVSKERQATLSEDALLDSIAQEVVRRAENLLQAGLQKVVNGTGVILNTNLGRAPLAEAVLTRLNTVSLGYCNLEMDLGRGKRGERGLVAEELLRLLTGCEAALIVNNNAAAVMLTVAALCKGKEVIVSRGELVEIGGSFRLPDVIESAGGELKEVGTTNRTRAGDYQSAISPRTGMLFKCHRSNFEISGFTEEASEEDLLEIAHTAEIPFVEDLGSGALFDTSTFGLKQEPTVDSVIAKGIDLVMFSGDKLLGGSQAGIITGKKTLVERLRKDPIYRALRADKVSIALIESTLSLYLSPHPEHEVPILKLANASIDILRSRAEDFCQKCQQELEGWRISVVPTESTMGGGSTPGQTLPSVAVKIECRRDASRLNASAISSADRLASLLRSNQPPIIGTVDKDALLLDFRAFLPGDEDVVLIALKKIQRKSSLD